MKEVERVASMPEVAGSIRWFAIAAVVLLVDQLTKYWIVSGFYHGQSVTITSFFNLVLVHNEGAAFSFLSEAGGWQRWFFTGI